MALITLQEAKDHMRVIHSYDDTEITLLVNAAQDEAVQYMGYDKLQDFEDFLSGGDNPYDNPPEAVKTGCLLLVEGMYESTTNDSHNLRKLAEKKLAPYRIGLGV